MTVGSAPAPLTAPTPVPKALLLLEVVEPFHKPLYFAPGEGNTKNLTLDLLEEFMGNWAASVSTALLCEEQFETILLVLVS